MSFSLLNINYQNNNKNNLNDISIDFTEKSIGVLGLTYKPGTSTLRRSLPLEIVKKLVDMSIPEALSLLSRLERMVKIMAIITIVSTIFYYVLSMFTMFVFL